MSARINEVTIHSACNFSKEMSRGGSGKMVDGIKCSSAADLYGDGQVRAAGGDPTLRRLLTRIRHSIQDRSDVDLLNSRCYREGEPIPCVADI